MAGLRTEAEVAEGAAFSGATGWGWRRAASIVLFAGELKGAGAAVGSEESPSGRPAIGAAVGVA